MRSNEQQTHRYFGAVWAALALVIGIGIVTVLIVHEPIPDYAYVISIVLTGIAAGVIGFLHGITVFVAREHDAREAEVVDDDADGSSEYVG